MILDEREIATILAALRFWQANQAQVFGTYAEHFTDLEPLNAEEIDSLCESLSLERGA